MANFNTHISVAALGAGMLSTALYAVDTVNASEAVMLTLAGTVGGILPDIDLEHSYPTRILFTILGVVFAFMKIFSLQESHAILTLWAIGLGVFFFVRWPLWFVFQSYTVHRGAIHSVAAGTLSGLVTCACSQALLNTNAFMSWVMGAFVFLGFVLHLLLDEIYSVDFMNQTVKRSFGTALKLVDWRPGKKRNSLIILTACIPAWLATPNSDRFFHVFGDTRYYQLLGNKLLPEGWWQQLKAFVV